MPDPLKKADVEAFKRKPHTNIGVIGGRNHPMIGGTFAALSSALIAASRQPEEKLEFKRVSNECYKSPNTEHNMVILAMATDALKMGKEALTERILKTAGRNHTNTGVVMLNSLPDNGDDLKKIVREAMEQSNQCQPNVLVVVPNDAIKPEDLSTEMEIPDSLFDQKKLPNVLDIPIPKFEAYQQSMWKESQYERANPNQPFYAKFQKKEKKSKKFRR